MAADALSEDELMSADDTLAAGEMERQKKLARYKLRQDALNALMSED
jgi:roadblock/LC7 domain-containing protein